MNNFNFIHRRKSNLKMYFVSKVHVDLIFTGCIPYLQRNKLRLKSMLRFGNFEQKKDFEYIIFCQRFNRRKGRGAVKRTWPLDKVSKFF